MLRTLTRIVSKPKTKATSGLVFAKQAAAADVAGGGSSWQQAGSGRKQAGLVTRQLRVRDSHRQVGSARAGPLAFSPVAGQPHHFSDYPKNGEQCEMRVFRCYGTRSRAASSRRNTHQQVGSARASPLAFNPIACQPRRFSPPVAVCHRPCDGHSVTVCFNLQTLVLSPRASCALLHSRHPADCILPILVS